MKALSILNAALLVLFSTMAVVIGVVCILYAFNLDASPRMRSDLDTLMQALGWFTLAAVLTGVAFVGVWRRKPWRWPAQIALVVALPLPLAMLYGLMT